MTSGVWLLPLGTMAGGSSASRRVRASLLLRPPHVPLRGPATLGSCPAADGHLVCFRLLHICEQGCRTHTCTHAYLGTCSLSFGCVPRSGTAGSWGHSVRGSFAGTRVTVCSSQAILRPISNGHGFRFPTSFLLPVALCVSVVS